MRIKICKILVVDILLYDLNPNFSVYAQSINELFYYYVQHCTNNEDELLLTSTDIHNILEVVTIF